MSVGGEERAHLPAEVPGGDLVKVRAVGQPVLQHRMPLGEEVLLQQADQLRARQHARPRHDPVPGRQILRHRIHGKLHVQRVRQLRQDGAPNQRSPFLTVKHLRQTTPLASHFCSKKCLLNLSPCTALQCTPLCWRGKDINLSCDFRTSVCCTDMRQALPHGHVRQGCAGRHLFVISTSPPKQFAVSVQETAAPQAWHAQSSPHSKDSVEACELLALCHGERRARAEASDGCQACSAVASLKRMGGYRSSSCGPSISSHGCSQACSGTRSCSGSHDCTALLSCARTNICQRLTFLFLIVMLGADSDNQSQTYDQP